ncbi:MAG: hypothetical protein ACEPO8_11300 [Rhodothermaceae bacterium]
MKLSITDLEVTSFNTTEKNLQKGTLLGNATIPFCPTRDTCIIHICPYTGDECWPKPSYDCQITGTGCETVITCTDINEECKSAICTNDDECDT